MEVYVDDMIIKSKNDVDHDHDLRKTFDILRAFSMKLNPKKCVFGVRPVNFWGSWSAVAESKLNRRRSEPYST